VKTNGSTIFFAAQGAIYAVDVTTGRPRLVGTLRLPATGYDPQLLLNGSRLIVISSGGTPVPVPLAGGVGGPGVGRGGVAPPGVVGSRPRAAVARPAVVYPYYYGAQTVVTEVDVSDPAAMRVARMMTVDGNFVDARQNGATARLVISSTPYALEYSSAVGQAAGWVPSIRFHSMVTGRRFTRPVAACDAISRPAVFSGLGIVSILTIDLDRGLYALRSQALMADPRIVYGSQTSLYVVTDKWIAPNTPLDQLPSSQSTVIDQFDASSPDQTPLIASGEVPGYVLNQFSLSEYNGYLRVASTSTPIWWGATPPTELSQSYVTVLSDRGGILTPVGQVSGLGLGEQIYSVRFLQTTGFVVTYRQVDPLYTLDLTVPTAPRVAGKLELRGYSAYLQPITSGLLLGIGQDVGTNNEPTGSQLELFDVSNPSAPRLLGKTSLGFGSSSEAQYDHHAFLYWPPTGLAVLPVEVYPIVTGGPPSPAGSPPAAGGGSSTTTGTQSEQQFVGALAFQLDSSGITAVGQIVQDPINGYSPQILRSVVVGDELFTFSDVGVMASSLHTLARLAFTPFPQPTPVASPPPEGVASPPARGGG
jgi:hypothetical protein